MVFPTLTILLATVLIAVPWGLPAWGQYILPFVSIMIIYYWTMRQPEYMPSIVVFLAGASSDVLTGSPLGYWALLFLIAHSMAYLFRHLMVGKPDRLRMWQGLVAASLVTAGLSWGAGSLYTMRILDWWPMAIAASLSIVGFPILVILLAAIRRILSPGPRRARAHSL